MKIINVALIALLLTTSPLFAADTLSGKIVNVSDGDTVTLLVNNTETFKVRLSEIDAPEKSQAWGNKAKQALTMLVATKNVTVLSSGKDRYGRILGTLFLNERNINKLMVQNGDAWAYTKYVTDHEYFRLQDQAKNSQIGLWSMDENQIIPPWEWRQNAKSKKTK